MNRFTTTITEKKKNTPPEGISVAILSAGVGNRIKSYEPRSLLKLQGSYLIDRQIQIIKEHFHEPEVIPVLGYDVKRIIKKSEHNLRVVENQLYDETNSSESLRLAVNNCENESFMFMHGDLLFNKETLMNCYKKSFILVDNNGLFKDSEVGVTTTIGDKGRNCASIMSYGLNCKWGQMAYFTGAEFKMLKSVTSKMQQRDKKLLSFEIINRVIEMGGVFECLEPDNMVIVEIDRIKDIR
jgi:choline kinase